MTPSCSHSVSCAALGQGLQVLTVRLRSHAAVFIFVPFLTTAQLLFSSVHFLLNGKQDDISESETLVEGDRITGLCCRNTPGQETAARNNHLVQVSVLKCLK